MTDEIDDIIKAFATPLEYCVVQNPDGTFRNMTAEERVNFKPTHVETWGEKNGVSGCFRTCLSTGKTEFSPLIPLHHPNQDL